MTDIEQAAVEMIDAEDRYRAACNGTNFTREYAYEHIRPAWERVQESRKQLRDSVERLNQKLL